MQVSIYVRIYLLAFLSVAWLQPLEASSSQDPFCNGRQTFGGALWIRKMNPAYATDCYVHVRKIIRKASGYDSNLHVAEGIVETLFILDPDSPFPKVGLAELEMRKRELGLASKSLYEIYRLAMSASNVKPPVVDAFVTLGRFHLLSGCLPCASEAVENATALDASSPELLLLMASIEKARGNISAALTIISETLASQSTQLNAEIRLEMLLKISMLYALRKEYGAASESLNRAINIDPANPVPYHAQARLHLLTGDTDAAMQAVATSNKIRVTMTGKRLESFTKYLAWARRYSEGDDLTSIKDIGRTAFVAPEEAFVESARYETTSIITEALLQTKVIKNIDTRDDQGATALMVASQSDNNRLVEVLIAHNADLNAQNNRGERSLTYLVSNGNHALAKAMLDAGAEVNYVDINGHSPLSLAVFREDQLLVRELIERDASRQPVIELANQLGISGIEKIIDSMVPESI